MNPTTLRAPWTELPRRRLLGLGGGAALAGLLAACGRSATTPDPTAQEVAGPTGATLRVGAVAAAGTAVSDPHGSLFNESDWLRLSAVYDVLVGQDEAGRPAPALATSWEPDDEARVWAFTLRTDAVFSDGRPVTAEDVLYSLQRLHELAAQNGARLGTLDVAASSVVGTDRLELVAAAPDAELPATLSLGVFVVPAGTTDFASPVGSGAFVLDTLDDQGAALRRHEGWWGEAPLVQALELRGFSDPQALTQAVGSAVVDVALAVAPAAAEAAGDTLVVSVRPGAECVPLLLRVDTAPFDAPGVRRAVKLALDRQALVEQVYLGYGTVGRDAIKLDDPSVPSDLPEASRDLAEARKLLAEAGHPDGLDVVLHTTTAYPAMLPTATVAAQQLAEAGIRVEVREHDPQLYWSEAYTVEPFTVGYYADTTFATTVRQTVLSTSAFSETGWEDEEFDTVFAEAMAETDGPRRLELLGGLHRRMAEEGGWVVWGFGDGIDLHAPGVSGLPTTGARYDLSGVDVPG